MSMNKSLRLLYNAAVKLQTIGPTHLLERKRRVPAERYEFFKMPKHRSIMLLRDLKHLNMIEFNIQLQKG